MGNGRFNFLKNNPGYYIWFVINFLIILLILGYTWDSFFVALVIYGVSIMLALSPAGEAILRAMSDTRPVATNAERNRLMPLFHEVYEKARARRPSISSNVNLYIIDDLTPNACAIGRNSIAVTRGITEALTDDEIQGILGHEFAHLANGDTMALLVSTIGNAFMVITLYLAKIVVSVAGKVFRAFFWTAPIGVAFKFLVYISDYIIFGLCMLGIVIITFNGRKGEYIADRFSLEIGYGQNLIDALTKLDQIHIEGKRSLLQMIQATHPKTPLRIGRLEEQFRKTDNGEHYLTGTIG